MHQLIDQADWYAQQLADGIEVNERHAGNIVAVLDEFIRRASWAQVTT